jgi:hypothetical protein
MPMEQFSKRHQKTIFGVSIRMIAPTGQYSPTREINWGLNKWAFKPEFGHSRCWGTGCSILMAGLGSIQQTLRTSTSQDPHH